MTERSSNEGMLPPCSFGGFYEGLQEIAEIELTDLHKADLSDLVVAGKPVVVRGVMEHLPLVKAARQSSLAAQSHLTKHYSGAPLLCFSAPAKARGHLLYNDDATVLDFTREAMDFAAFLDCVNDAAEQINSPSYYIGSSDIARYFPGLISSDGLLEVNSLFQENAPLLGIWMGNQTVAAAHYDVSHNLAICTGGRRRFTLFPPHQAANLYPGPMDPTPGGQVVSMVDFENPDEAIHPGFNEALNHAQTAQLEPGDAIIIPALWWHRVEALDAFNVLINYWWNEAPQQLDDPSNALLHAILSLRDRSDTEKNAWKEVFDYYVFGDANQPTAHLPPSSHGPLAPLTPTAARQLRALLLSRLNR